MKLDIEAIKKRHLDPERNRGRTYYAGHIEVDLAAVVEEVEYLRKERPAVVAWLHKHELFIVADLIDRGVHLEEKP